MLAWLLDVAAGPGPLLALAALALALAAFAAALAAPVRASGAEHRARLRTTLRDRTLRTSYLPLRDPGIPGRSQPRAPALA
ncbi:DUF6412 domain-containing protein [Actinomadura flavalba]|uniref:DUF6412 domain-containing protein n=1 Tax=Actinomadura flavalba TaxID=1120938 RepID=UPI00036D37B8|nr:DUF6412 domain-containing protein [Actinomadura flavalba]